MKEIKMNVKNSIYFNSQIGDTDDITPTSEMML